MRLLHYTLFHVRHKTRNGAFQSVEVAGTYLPGRARSEVNCCEKAAANESGTESYMQRLELIALPLYGIAFADI
jgi:hypothetical protein